ncbi:transposase domain-containing protein [Pseudomonas sp. FSL L8-0168]|nr:transposase domain-containing protein [Pseudomonas sp. CCI1.1]WPX50692.1 transposase domain-containing protein [Pseudomonas sp. CCI1.1]
MGFDPATQRASHDAINGHDPYAYLKGVLTRLPSQRASEIEVAGS